MIWAGKYAYGHRFRALFIRVLHIALDHFTKILLATSEKHKIRMDIYGPVPGLTKSSLCNPWCWGQNPLQKQLVVKVNPFRWVFLILFVQKNQLGWKETSSWWLRSLSHWHLLQWCRVQADSLAAQSVLTSCRRRAPDIDLLGSAIVMVILYIELPML